MTSVDIPINDIDYESLFGGFETISNNTTSATTENDVDSRISDTPPLVNGLNKNFDIWPWNMESPLSDDPNNESYDFNALINDQNSLMLTDAFTDSDSSTLDELLAVFELPDQQHSEASPNQTSFSPSSIQNPYPSPPPSSSTIVPSSPPVSAQRPILLPKPSTPPSINYPQQQITNCVKLQSYGGTASTGTKCVKIEPVMHPISSQPPPTNITIITTSKPITLAKVPVIKMPLNTNATPITIVKTEADMTGPSNVRRITTVYPNNNNNNTDNQSLASGTFLKTIHSTNGMTSPPAKRRRSESSTNHQQLPIQSTELSTLTLDQLKVQYGNVSEEALKKHLRMIKNRESASLSRKRRKQLMENLEVKVKELSDENEKLKGENTKLLTRMHTLEMENDLLKTYTMGNVLTSRTRKPLILMGIVLLVVFNVFTLRSLSPSSNDPMGSLDLYNHHPGYNNEGSIVRGRTILSADRSSSNDPFIASSDPNDGSGGNGNNNPNNSSLIPTYPYLQCVAYINKTHSQRINRDLHSWVQDHYPKQDNIDKNKPMTIPDSNSISIPNNPDIDIVSDSSEQQHVPRKVAVLNRRTSKTHSTTKGQLQPYKGYEPNYEDFIHAIDRKNDTLYFVSFKRDHLILPATVTNQTQRPKMSLILPASISHLNKSIHVPNNHVPMIQIDCEVEDTKLVFVKQGHIPSFYRRELFRYYASVPQTTV